jgi:hypothetical protein
MGKTSLLRNLGRLLPRTIVPLFVDGQRSSLASDYPDFLYSLAGDEKIGRAAAAFRFATLESSSLGRQSFYLLQRMAR